MKIDGITTIGGVDVLSGSKLLNFTIADPADPSKQFAIDVSGVATLTTRTLTFPDQDLDFTPDTGTFASATPSLETISAITPAKGSLIAGSGTVPGEWAEVTVGANGTVLIADSTAANGVRWFALGVSTQFPDDTFRIQNVGDPTREIAFSAANITTATTRTWTAPDQDLDFTPDTGTFAAAPIVAFLENVVEDTTPQLGGALDVQTNVITTSIVDGNITLTPNGVGNTVLGTYTFDGNQALGPGLDNFVLTYDDALGIISLEASTGGTTFSDAVFRIQDDVTPTKEIAFQASGISAGVTRTITMPNSDVDLGLVATALQSVSQDGAPILGGNLNTNSNFIEVTTGTGIRDLNSNEQLLFNTTAAAATYFEITNATTGNPPVLSAAGEVNTDISIQPAGTGDVILGNYTFDGNQTLGVGVDNFVLTYDNATGLISLEAAAGGGGVSVQEEGSPIPNTPHTTLNFVGSSVTATDAGAGVADITITGGGGGAAAGAWQVIQTQTANNSANIDFLLPGGFSSYLLVINELVLATDSISAFMRFSNDGGATFKSGAGNYAWSMGADATNGGSAADTEIELWSTAFGTQLGNVGGENSSWSIAIAGALNSAVLTEAYWTASAVNDAGNIIRVLGSGNVEAAEVNDAVRILAETGNIASGEFILLGLVPGAGTGSTSNWRQLDFQTASNVASIDVVIPSGYEKYRVTMSGVVPATDGANLYLRTSNDGGSTFTSTAGAYTFAGQGIGEGGGGVNTNSASATQIQLTQTGANGIGNGTGESLGAVLEIHNAMNSSLDTLFSGTLAWINTADAAITNHTMGRRTTAEVNDAVQFLMSAGNITSGTFILEGYTSTGSITGKQTMWVPAAAMTPTTTGGCATLAQVELTANQPELTTLDFDSTVAEAAQFQVAFPKSWDEGTVSAQFFWSHSTTATNFGVVWGIQGVAVSNDDPFAPAYGTAITTLDTGGTTDDLYVSPESTAVTIGGTPLEGDLVTFRVFRDATNGSDNLAIDARLSGIKLFYTTNAGNDA